MRGSVAWMRISWSGACCCGLLAAASTLSDGGVGSNTQPAGSWYSGECGAYRWTFRESRRMPFGPFGLGEGQHQRTFVWLGSAASAPQVAMEGLSGGKLRQPLPMPTAWATVGNVLYVGCRNVTCGSWCCGFDAERAGADVVAALRDWQRTFPEFAMQPLYLAAHWRNGGQLIGPTLETALNRDLGTAPGALKLQPLQIAGVLVSESSSPTAHFFSHSQLETGNGETKRSLQMAQRVVSCSEHMEAVKLVMNDAQFLYAPLTRADSSETRTIDYELVSVSTFDHCYGANDGGIDALELEVETWASETNFALLELSKGMSKRAAYRPSLPKDERPGVFPHCGFGDHNKKADDMDMVWELVGRYNLRLLLLSDQAVDRSIHCSFYIGIFDADGLAWSPWQQFRLMHFARTNHTEDKQEYRAMSPSISANVLETELINSAEGEVWVTGEGPIGTAFSSEYGPSGGAGLVSWVRISPQKVCIQTQQPRN